MIWFHIKFVSFDELGAETSWIKGGPGKQSGGTPSGQSGGHVSPEESASHHSRWRSEDCIVDFHNC